MNFANFFLLTFMYSKVACDSLNSLSGTLLPLEQSLIFLIRLV